MATDKLTDIDPLSQLYDNLKTIVSDMVVKFSVLAEKAETFESKRNADEYISALDEMDEFGLYEYTTEDFNAVGIYNEDAIKLYKADRYEIPKQIREQLLINRRKNIIANYEEQNEYYRELNGLPPINTVGGRIITDIVNRSLLVVNKDDLIYNTEYELTDARPAVIGEVAAFLIMGNFLFREGQYIVVYRALIQDEPTSFGRSFKIVSNDTEIEYSMKSVLVKDVKNIFYSMGEPLEVPDEDLIGKYIHINTMDTLDSTKYVRNGYLVVPDDYEEYNDLQHVKITEALMNNDNCKLGDVLLLENFHYVNDEMSETYGISKKVPLHMIRDYYGDRFITILESNDYLDKMADAYPNEKYLRFIGVRRIGIERARKAKNFELLYMQRCNREIIQSVFATMYAGSRDYFVNTVYNYYYRDIYDYYDNYIGLAIVQFAINQTIVRSMQKAIDRDFYDETLVRLLFDMYGVPYYYNLPYQTQRRLTKNLNYLLRKKGTNEVIYDIANILGYHDVQVYKYYLVKERNFDTEDEMNYTDTTEMRLQPDSDGELVDTETVVNDLERMYDVYFQKVELREEDIYKAITDKAYKENYDYLTNEDPLWWEDSETFDEVYGDTTKQTAESEVSTYHRHYNFMETKYLGITISYKMSEVLYENIIFLRTVFEKKDELTDVFVTLPRITGTLELTLFETVVWLCAIMCKQNHLTGEILTKYNQVMDVFGYMEEDATGYRSCDTLGFNYDLLTDAETFKELLKDPSRYVRKEEEAEFYNYFSVLTLNQNTVEEKVDAINEMFENIRGLGYFIGRKMSEAENIFEYRAWRDFYNALFIAKENNIMFTMGNTGRVAKTYAEYLSIMNPKLYDLLEEANDTTLYTYADHTISRLEKVIHDLSSIYTLNDSISPLLDYLIRLVRFFKSYTVDLVDVGTQFVFDSRPDNLFKLVEYYKVHHIIVPPDTMRIMYSDTMKILETLKEHDELKFREIMWYYHTILVGDVFPINNVVAKDFECKNYCRINKDECTGSYLVNSNEVLCKYFKYDTSEFFDYIMNYKRLLLSIGYDHLSDIHGMIRTHLQAIYSIYALVDDMNPYTDDYNSDIDVYKSKMVDTLNKLNNLFVAHNIDLSISTAGVDGIISWVNLLTVRGSNIQRICKNPYYPCREDEPHRRLDKEYIAILQKIYHSDSLGFDEYIEIYMTNVMKEELTLRDELHHIYQTVNEDDDYKLTDEVIHKLTNMAFDYNKFHDTVKREMENVMKDKFKFRDEIIIIESDPE